MSADLWILPWSPLLLAWTALALLVTAWSRRAKSSALVRSAQIAADALVPFALAAGATRLVSMVFWVLFYGLTSPLRAAQMPLADHLAAGLVNGYLYGWLWSIGFGVVATAAWEKRRRDRQLLAIKPLPSLERNPCLHGSLEVILTVFRDFFRPFTHGRRIPPN